MNRRTDFTAQLEPTLRFPEFTGEWQEKRLGEIAMFLRGSGVSKSDIVDNGNREAIRYGELYTVYNEKVSLVKSRINGSQRDTLSNKNDVILPSSGETAIDISTATFVGKDGVALGGDLNIVRTQESGLFLSYYLNHRKRYDIAKLAQGISVVHLYASDLKTLQIQLPIMEEQQKIAAFLAAVDKRVALLERKVQQLEAYKRGVMQRLFSQQLRFTRPDGSHFPVWQEKRLGEVFLERSDRGIPGEMLSVTIANGVVPFSSIDKKDNSNPDKSKYKSVAKGDIVYNTMRMWQGASGLAVSSGICSPAYTVVIPKRGQLGLFWSYRIKNQDAINLFQRWSQGLTTDTWNLKFPVFSKLEFYCPSEEEQQKIAEFLSVLDEKIALTRQQLDKTKQFKKGLLQRMFV